MDHLKNKVGCCCGTTLFAFPYDWRQPLDSRNLIDSLYTKLEVIHKHTGQKVHVITPGTGGLLFFTLLKCSTENVYQHVSRWLSLATPFQGSAELLRSALEGANGGVEFFKFSDSIAADMTV